MKAAMTVLIVLVGLWVAAMVLGLLGRLVLMVTKPGWSRFTDAWEDWQGYASLSSSKMGFGMRSRSAHETSGTELAVMNAAYRRWRAEGHPPPKAWLAAEETKGE